MSSCSSHFFSPHPLSCHRKGCRCTGYIERSCSPYPDQNNKAERYLSLCCFKFKHIWKLSLDTVDHQLQPQGAVHWRICVHSMMEWTFVLTTTKRTKEMRMTVCKGFNTANSQCQYNTFVFGAFICSLLYQGTLSCCCSSRRASSPWWSKYEWLQLHWGLTEGHTSRSDAGSERILLHLQTRCCHVACEHHCFGNMFYYITVGALQEWGLS